MGEFKELSLTWIVLSVAVSVSRQQLISTLHEGNLTCPGDEVIFTCTIRDSSGLSVLALEWISTDYIGQDRSLQLSTTNSPGRVETSMMDGSVTATATLINSTNIGGELALVSTLRIVAVEASVVTCRGSNGVTESIEFSISDVPEAPLNVGATEISRFSESVCEIIIKWDPPANDIARYLVYINLSQGNTRREMLIYTNRSIIETLVLTDCRDSDNIGIKVAAVNSVGCVGDNSTEVQLNQLLVTVPTAPPQESLPQESSQLGVDAAVGITLGVMLPILFLLGIVLVVFIIYYMCVRRNERKDVQRSDNDRDMEPLISQMTQRVEALEEKQTKMTEDMTQLEHNNRVTQLKEQVTQVLSELSSTRDELKALKQQQEMEQVTQLEEHVTELENQLSFKLKAFEQEQTKVSKSQDIQEERMTQLEEHATKLENQLSSTRKELKALKQEQTEIKAKLNPDLQESSRSTIPNQQSRPFKPKGH